MGTRNLTCVIQDGEFKVAQYGQWDGYPAGQGATVLRFLEKADLNQFRSLLRKRCRFIDQKEFDERYKALGLPKNGMLNSGGEEVYKGAFPFLDRDFGAAILEEIYNATDLVELRDASSFAHDSLMCEWAYVVDLDRNVLEVYTGFNEDKDAPAGVFADVPPADDARDDEYGSIVLTQTYQLDDLPSVDALVEQCDPPEEDEE